MKNEFKNLKRKLMIIQKLYNKFKNLIISIKIFKAQ